MRTVYGNKKKDTQEITPGIYSGAVSPVSVEEEVAEALPYKEIEVNSPSPEIAVYQQKAEGALALVDDIVLKNYLTKVSEMDVVPAENTSVDGENVIMFKVNKMVYNRDEYAVEKFISVVNAMTYTDSSIFLIVDGHSDRTDFYLGIRCNDENRTANSVADTFRSALEGQFPGIELSDSLAEVNSDVRFSIQERFMNRCKDEASSISSYVGIPSIRNAKGEYNNANFIQGIEKFATAMQGKRYTAIILASNTSHKEINALRTGYETLYSELSAVSTQQLAYSTNESLANAMSRTKGTSDSVNQSETKGTSDSEGTTTTHTEGISSTSTKTTGSSKENAWGKVGKFAGPLMQAGAILCATGVGGPLGGVVMGAGVVAGLGGLWKGNQLTESTSESSGSNSSDSEAQSHTHTTNESHTEGTSHSENFSETDGTTSTIGSSKNFTLTIQNKHIQEIQKRIDKQLERIAMCESTGLWASSAYFISYGTERATAEIGATMFRSIMQGEQSGVEASAINTWYGNTSKPRNFKLLAESVASLQHPTFSYRNTVSEDISILASSMISSKELAMMMGLPRKSVPGFPVVEHISLAKEVIRLDSKEHRAHFELGCIYDQGLRLTQNLVKLDAKSLTQHTFITGSTGCGKSNTVYYLINQIRKLDNGPKFLIIEPAKGEYKDVFGNEHVYGTNPLKSKLLKINPFRFADGVHVLEHIDRLTEIFNVCWPMYAAMPAVLKEAMLNSYEDCGWDLYNSTNKYSNELFPTFGDLMNELILVINNSAYSEEVKSNYTGSLVTRVKSLTNGINKEIFSGNELGDQKLFDENVIVDLSRIGSQETKALIMGILILRLNEYRSNSNIEPNSPLRHVTILEEAHNILKKCSTEQSMEGSNVAGKSVEMISNSIAEMRTFGEGFVIVDQSPNAVDISAIRNTNTKIIMRLPEENDRKIAGKSAAMKDAQIDEIAKLPTGVAVVYQNDWEEPVLCQIGEFKEKHMPYIYLKDKDIESQKVDITADILSLLLKDRVGADNEVDVNKIKQNLNAANLSTANKWAIFEAIDEYETSQYVHLWSDNNFQLLSRLVSEILNLKSDVLRLTSTCSNFEALTEGLLRLISNNVPEISSKCHKELAHCLMCDYATGNAARMKVYSAWVQHVKKEISE